VTALRLAVGAVGVAVITYGSVVLLLTVDVLGVVPWVVGPVIVHDLLIAPLTIAAVWVGARYLPSYARTPALFGLVVSGSLTLVALSVVGRQGASDDNPSLLNRDYAAGWLFALTVTWVVVLLTVLLRRAAAHRQPEGHDAAAR